MRYGANSGDDFWYIFEVGEDGTETEVPISPEDWNDRNELLNNPWVNEIVADKFDNPEDYGLDEPSVNVWLATDGRENHEIFLGDPTPGRPVPLRRHGRRPGAFHRAGRMGRRDRTTGG